MYVCMYMHVSRRQGLSLCKHPLHACPYVHLHINACLSLFAFRRFQEAAGGLSGYAVRRPASLTLLPNRELKKHD